MPFGIAVDVEHGHCLVAMSEYEYIVGIGVGGAG